MIRMSNFISGRLRIFKENISQNRKSGMELVQVAILIAIAVVVGLIFKDKITSFVRNVFGDLMDAGF